MTGQQVAELGYVRIGMQDPEVWAKFGEEILGLAAVSSPNGYHLRMDSAPSRFIIEQAEEDAFICAGWRCPEPLYDRLAPDYAQGAEADAQARSVEAFVSGQDPSGNHFELFRGRGIGGAFQSPIEGVAFVAEELGLGHAVLPAANHAATSQFYCEQLGFGISDELTLPPPVDGAPEMVIHFLHAASARHHSLGLFNGPAPSGVVHLMVEMTTLDAVGLCHDRVNEAQVPITATIGRHVNDGMLSFYCLAPANIPVEVGFDGLQFDWSSFTPTKSTVGDVWGHAYNFPE